MQKKTQKLRKMCAENSGGHTETSIFFSGALAEKALRAIVPNNCPFTIRLTSEVLESNGMWMITSCQD